MQIRYNTPNSRWRRVMRPSDMARFGVEVDHDLVWEKANRWTLDLDDAACDALVSQLPEEFTILETPTITVLISEEAGNSSSDEQDDDSGADDPQGSPDESLIDADVMVDESPKAKRPRR